MAGCNAGQPATDPHEDCFALSGLPTPEFEAGERPVAVERWCGPSPSWVRYDRQSPRTQTACAIRWGRVGSPEFLDRFEYDAEGRMTEWRGQDGVQTYAYSGEALVGWARHGVQSEQRREWDQDGRLMRLEHRSHDGGWVRTTIFAYRDGQRVSTEETLVQAAAPAAGVAAFESISRHEYDVRSGAPTRVTVHRDGELTYLGTTRFEDGAFVTHIETEGETRSVRRSCDAYGNPFDPEADALRVNADGRVVRAGDHQFAYDAAGRQVRAPGKTQTYSPEGQLVCDQTLLSAASVWTWPPLRPMHRTCGLNWACHFEAMPDALDGDLPARATMAYDTSGRLSQMLIDLEADGTVETAIDLPYTLDGQGRLVHERWLGANWVLEGFHEYDCEALDEE